MADNVRAELARARVTQAKAAGQAGCSEAAFSKRMNGRLPFDVDQLGAIATLVGISPADLLAPKASA